VRLVTPPLDWSLVAGIPALSHAKDGPVKIVYATSRRDDTLYQIFVPALRQVLAEYPERVEMHFWGVAPEEFRGVPGVRFRKFILNYDQFLSQFARHGFDIGLAPLPDDVFHQSKTNNKFREYGACGIAGIYSNVSVYTGSVTDGKVGLLVENDPQAWYVALKRLIDDAGLRCRLGEAARRDLLEAYPADAFSAEWQRQIETVLAGSPALSNRPQHGTQVTSFDRPTGAAKMGQQIKLLATDPGIFLNNVGKHLQNFAWLLRLNIFKRL
jgi:hypothetical protein